MYYLALLPVGYITANVCGRSRFPPVHLPINQFRSNLCIFRQYRNELILYLAVVAPDTDKNVIRSFSCEEIWEMYMILVNGCLSWTNMLCSWPVVRYGNQIFYVTIYISCSPFSNADRILISIFHWPGTSVTGSTI